MGRRILPKLDPAIDFSRHLNELSELGADFQSQDWFPRIQPTEVEVGSGKGLFLLNQSGCHPERNFLGIEISKKYARYAAYRLAEAERDNARMIRGDAQKFFALFLKDSSVTDVHIYFPDPWWKARHRKRRIVSDSFVEQCVRVLIPGGWLHFWTDVAEYFQSGCETISQHEELKGPVTEEPIFFDPAAPYHTHFERRMLVNDHDVFRSKFQKVAS
jgi:tRNA (guanine-N7-)-methyltransferase